MESVSGPQMPPCLQYLNSQAGKMNCDEGYHGHAVCCEGDTTWDACGCGRGHQIRVLTRLAEQQVMMEAHTEASACSGEAPSTQAHGGMGIRKILGEIHESNHYLFQKLQYLLINCFVVKVCIKEIQSQALRVAKAINAVIAVSPENSERLSQFLLLLATTLKIAVIAHKDDRITRCSSPLKAIDRVNAAGELLKTWASLMSDELIISSGSLLQVMWQREGAGAVWSNPSAQQEFQTRYRRAQSLVKSRLQCMSSMQQTLREVKQVFLIKSCEVAAWCRNCNIHDMTYLTKTLGPGAQPQGVCAVPVPRRSWQPRLGRVASQWGCCRPWHRLNTYSAGHCQRSTRRLISVPEHCALKCPAKLARQSWNTFLNLSSTCGIVRRAA
jgi:hypothetical protein